jgi:hypothetical protein
MQRTFTFLLIGLSIIFILAGCSLPASAPLPTAGADDMDAALTQAAMTIVAELTQNAPATEVPPVDAPTDTADSVEPTVILISETPEASATPEPTSTATPEEAEEDQPTATPTGTPTPTVTPGGEIIYQDDFSNENRWFVTEEDDWSFYYDDGEYHITNELLGAKIWSIREFEMEDARIEVDGRRDEGPRDAFYGVMCRHSEEGENYYIFVVADNGFYGIGLRVDDEFEWLEEDIDETGVINTGDGAENRVTGECLDEQLTLFVNGEKIADALDDTLSDGVIGLVAGNQFGTMGVDAAFDNFVLIEP